MSNTISGDGEEIDSYLLEVYDPVNKFERDLYRINDDDDKLIIVLNYSDDTINT